jgi:hypothetical protein
LTEEDFTFFNGAEGTTLLAFFLAKQALQTPSLRVLASRDWPQLEQSALWFLPVKFEPKEA